MLLDGGGMNRGKTPCRFESRHLILEGINYLDNSGGRATILGVKVSILFSHSKGL